MVNDSEKNGNGFPETSAKKTMSQTTTPKSAKKDNVIPKGATTIKLQ